ncbi:MAG TPA: hypothetical protein VGA99_00290, partial [bacterium]
MVVTTLTNELIEAGKVLVHELDKAGLRPAAAFWFYFPDVQAWKLVIAESRVGANGPKEVYKQVQRILSKLSKYQDILSLMDVTLVRPDEPVVLLIRRAMRTGQGNSGIR